MALCDCSGEYCENLYPARNPTHTFLKLSEGVWNAERDPVSCCALFRFHVMSKICIWKMQQGWEHPDPDPDPVQIQIQIRTQIQIQIQIAAHALFL